MSLDDYFYKVKRRHPQLAFHCWHVLTERECYSPTSAISLSQIRGEFRFFERERKIKKIIF